ncbi:hypothetical protein [Nocardioides luteus]|uniref:hypothetical protein n=1 Tax=Nocardioides luteus TaxID=1844 RepID=UPI0018CB0FD4|nr:hypothetical protein [Nocardioides luteus]MBG6095802.1 hypothetical protein [Nocardioides luteus]
MSPVTEPIPDGKPHESTSTSRRWAWAMTAVAAVLAVAVVVFIALAVRSEDGDRRADPSPSASSTATPSPSTSTTPTESATPSPTPTRPTPTSPSRFGFQPLWPFAGVEEAAVWQQAYREGGHQPWHLDAGLVALRFTQSYLGYQEVDRVLRVTISDDQAWVDVGFRLPDGKASTSAILHLAKIGTGSYAPWEVVGTKDSTLSLTTPRYGATVTSPMAVGGRITGVDESLVVRVLRLGTGEVGHSPGVPAGGQDRPWSTTMPFAAPAGSVLTIAVSTGGHVAGVERFAITGVRVGP